MERYAKPITEIPEHECELWSHLAFNLRTPTRTNKIEHWDEWFNLSTYLYLTITPDGRTHSYATDRNHEHIATHKPLTLELLQVLNLLKITRDSNYAYLLY